MADYATSLLANDPLRLCDLQTNWAHSPRNSSRNSTNMLRRLKSQLSSSKKRDSILQNQNSFPRQFAHMSTKGNDPPPAYAPVANAAPVNTSSSTSDPHDDPYDFLREFDTVFLIDDSGSMSGANWTETTAALEAITPVCTKYDADGIDIYFLNAPDDRWHRHVTKVQVVHEIFSQVRPSGATPTGKRLMQILYPYVKRVERKEAGLKPLNVIVITDGVPTDDLESVLIKVAKDLDKIDAPAWQLGIQFFQVGRDRRAREHLKQLDDDLAEIAKSPDLRDIIDTVPFKDNDGTTLSATGILKVVLGAVNRRLDRGSRELYR